MGAADLLHCGCWLLAASYSYPYRFVPHVVACGIVPDVEGPVCASRGACFLSCVLVVKRRVGLPPWLARIVTETLSSLGLIPRPLRKYLALLWQRYRGDITIVPYASVSDYARILSNPSREFIEKCTIEGARRTWPKLPLIEARCAIEQVGSVRRVSWR